MYRQSGEKTFVLLLPIGSLTTNSGRITGYPYIKVEREPSIMLFIFLALLSKLADLSLDFLLPSCPGKVVYECSRPTTRVVLQPWNPAYLPVATVLRTRRAVGSL